MKHPIPLTAVSVAGAILFTIHLAHDFTLGIDSMTQMGTFTYLSIMLVWLYGAAELQGRRSGYIIVLIAALLSVGVPVLHIVGGPRSSARGFYFVWTLLAMGASGVLAGAIAVRELIASIRQRPA